MTKLQIANYILQFLCFRLMRVVDNRIENFELKGVSVTEGSEGKYNVGIEGKGRRVKYECYQLQGWIRPLTGWDCTPAYIWWGKSWSIQLTKWKKVPNTISVTLSVSKPEGIF